MPFCPFDQRLGTKKSFSSLAFRARRGDSVLSLSSLPFMTMNLFPKCKRSPSSSNHFFSLLRISRDGVSVWSFHLARQEMRSLVGFGTANIGGVRKHHHGVHAEIIILASPHHLKPVHFILADNAKTNVGRVCFVWQNEDIRRPLQQVKGYSRTHSVSQKKPIVGSRVAAILCQVSVETRLDDGHAVVDARVRSQRVRY